jgi:two-component system, sensor histidine kinase and response regulator
MNQAQVMKRQRLKVLLVEDNPGDARLIQESLADASDQSFDLEIAETLGIGLKRLHLGGIDAMLLDLALPDSFGMETFVRAKAQALGVAIIVLTGLDDDSLALKLVQGGAQDFVAKVDVSGNNLTRAILYAVERERLEQEFRKLNLELEQRVKDRTAELEVSNRDLEAFSFSVSHDLRAPLVNLIGFAELLETKSGKQLDEQGTKYLARIHEAAFKMSHLIDDMLRLAKVGRQGLRKGKFPLRLIVDEVLAELGSEIEKREIDWRIMTLPVIDCDHALMKQALANLISNAVKYTRPREKAIIEIGQQTMDGQAVFFVRDNGVGFDMKAADKLFAPFQRLHRDEEFEGTGIGLATVQRIVQKHRGRIWAESEPGRGSTFFFTLSEETGSVLGSREGSVALV